MRSLRNAGKRVQRARRLRRDVTEAERRLWWHLRRLPAEGSHFRRQATIGPYFADFACHATRLVIELDGGRHNRDAHARRDATRESYLRDNGYRVLRFWNNDVMQNLDGVPLVILETLESAAPPPLTPPHRFAGGGEERAALVTGFPSPREAVGRGQGWGWKSASLFYVASGSRAPR